MSAVHFTQPQSPLSNPLPLIELVFEVHFTQKNSPTPTEAFHDGRLFCERPRR